MSNPARDTGPKPASLGREETPTLSIVGPAATALMYMLNNTTATELHRRMKDALWTRQPEITDRLLSSLEDAQVFSPKLVACSQDRTPRHCVRCHTNYVETKNHLDACKARHQPPDKRYIMVPTRGAQMSAVRQTQASAQRSSRGEHVITVEGREWNTIVPPPGMEMVTEWTYRCCRKTIYGGTSAPIHGSCFQARHTTASEIVNYALFPGTCSERKCHAPVGDASRRQSVNAAAGSDVNQARA